MSSVSKKYIKIRAKKVFVQILGKGPAIALLHPSPHSSDILLPLAQKLSTRYTVICIDTPGYGRSDALEHPPKDLSAYTAVLQLLFQKMGLSEVAIYGAATGAQIGIRFALDHPNMVSHLFLDSAAHFDDGLRERILEKYFPDLTPRKDGGHLAVIWDIVSNLFQYFPWCFRTPEFALNRPQAPLDMLHMIALDFLNVGKDYDLAYRAAFLHEKAQHVQNLKVPTTIFRWEGSIILPHIDALVNHDFSENVVTVNLNKDRDERTEAMVAHIIEKRASRDFYKMLIDVGEEYQEAVTDSYTEAPPEITAEGSYLKEAWQFICDKEQHITPEEIQRKLILWYKQKGK